MPLHQLAEPITIELTLPPGEVSYVDEELRLRRLEDKEIMLHAWTPGWLRWRSGERSLTLSEWSFDHVRVTPKSGAGVTLTMSLWDPRQHPAVASCEVRDRDGLTLAHRMSVTWGERQDVYPSRLPQGFEAALVPIFTDARWHPDKALHEGAAKDREDMAQRARALLYGHSSAQDPRHGSAGLLGANLGGTLLIDPKHADHPELQAQLQELGRARAELGLWRWPTRQDADKGARAFGAAEPPSCEAYLQRRAGASQETLIELGQVSQGDYLNALKPRVGLVIGDEERVQLPPAVTPDLPLALTAPQLSGQRQALTEQLLSKLYTQRLIKERGVAWFAAPLIATRNPLVELAQHQLLEPDRYGHWSLNPELASALGQIELLQEGRGLTMMSAQALGQHWRAARQVRLREQPDGALLLEHQGQALTHFTLIAHGATPTTIDEAPLSTTRDMTTPSGELQRWFWFDLKPGLSRVSFQESRDMQSLRPTHWRVHPL